MILSAVAVEGREARVRVRVAARAARVVGHRRITATILLERSPTPDTFFRVAVTQAKGLPMAVQADRGASQAPRKDPPPRTRPNPPAEADLGPAPYLATRCISGSGTSPRGAN